MRRLIIIPFFLLPLFLSAQENFKEPFIEVTGTAYREIEPDEIYVMIRIKEFEEDREKTSLEKLEKEFYNAVKEAGIERDRVVLSDAGSGLDDFRRRDKESYRSKTFQIKLTSAAELEKFIEKLSPVEVDSVDVTRLHHTDYEKIKLDLKMEALKMAKDRAKILVESIGSELGRPLMIRDFDFGQPYMEMKANVRMMSMDGQQPEDPIAFRKIKMEARITAQFEIL